MTRIQAKKTNRGAAVWLMGASLAAVTMLTGCSMGTINLSGPVAGTKTSGSTFAGRVYGGQQPVTGSTIQLYAAGTPAMPSSGGSTGGYGQGAAALIPTGSMSASSANNYYPGGASGCTIAGDGSNPSNCTSLPQTDSSGSFSITGDYTCASDSQVYIVATGGNPQVGASGSNNYIALMAGLGSCAAGNTLSSSLVVNINEVTTVATVWALQQFMTTPSGTAASGYVSQGGATSGVGVNIGAPSGPVGGYGASGVQTSVSGLMNAFSMINNLTDISLGSSGNGSTGTAHNSWATPWAAKINTIADILAACVNTDPGSDSTCASLMSSATPTSSTAAKDTIQAAWYMAQNPTNNVGTLFHLISGTPPFTALTTAPSDWAIFVGISPTFSGGVNAVSSPFNGVVDEYGHVWLTNYNPGGTPFVSELGVDGAALAGPFSSYTVNGGYSGGCSTTDTHTLTSGSTGPKGIAIDLSNVVWINNPNETACTGSVRTMMRVSGSTGYSPTSGGWVAPTVTNGYFENGSTYSGIAVDGSGNVYVANSGSTGKVMEFASGSGTYSQGASLGSSSPSWIAIDANSSGSGPSLWTFGSKDCSTTLGQVYQQPLSDLATAASVNTYQNTGCTGGTTGTTGTVTNINATLGTPYTAAVDRNNAIWSANSVNNTVNWFVPNTNGVLDTTAATSVTSSSGLGGIVAPFAIAVDGNNNAWVGSSSSSSPYYVALLQGTAGSSATISLAPQLNGTGNAGLGFTYPNVSSPFPRAPRGIAVDPSGNVWLFNNSTSTAYTWVSVLVGQAAPVITPLALQLAAGKIGQKP